MLTRIYTTLRVNNWWNTKLPPLWGISFLLIYSSGLTLSEAVPRLAVLLIWMIGAAGFGHYVNDWSDIEQDQRAGKSNAASGHTKMVRWLISSGLFCLALLPWVGYWLIKYDESSGTNHLLPVESILIPVIFHLLLFIVYSTPPLRLKERGIGGIIFDALYAHAVPTAVVIACFMANPFYQLIGCITGWQFLVGLRHIIFHQIEDVQNDHLAKTQTWMIGVSINRILKVVTYGLLPLEIMLFVTIAFLISPLLVGGAFLLFIGLKYSTSKTWQLPTEPVLRSVHQISAYVSNFYEQILPWLFLAMLIFTSNIHFIWVALVQFLLYPKPLRQFWDDISQLPRQFFS